MTFVAPTWVNGNVITEVKLNQMVANEEHVREEADYTILLSGDITRTASSEQDPNLTVSIDTTAIATYTTSGAKSLIDYDISGFSDGLRTIVFNLDGISRTHRFVKTPDMTRLTMWVTALASSASPYETGARACTIIAHLGNNSWT